MGLRRKLAVLLTAAVAAVGSGALAQSVEAVALSPVTSAHSCSGSYVHAALPWGHKCLRAGQYCKIDGDRYYHRFGFHCHRSSHDSRGDYHLTR
jgi:hypothetical protein